MPRVKVQIDDRGLMGKLHDLSQWKGETIGEIVRRHTRTCCVYLANFTQPFGDTIATKKQGEAAVERDIKKLFKDMEGLTASVENWKVSAWQQALLAALRKQDLPAVVRLLEGSNLKGRVIAAPSRETHERYRNNLGRVRTGGYFEFVQKAAALRSYIKQRQMKVGYAKSVWCTATSKLDVSLKNPGAGFPAWVARNKGPARVTDRTGDPFYPSVTVSSSLPWMDKVITKANRGRALISAKENMLKYIEMTWKGELRRRYSNLKKAA